MKHTLFCFSEINDNLQQTRMLQCHKLRPQRLKSENRKGAKFATNGLETAIMFARLPRNSKYETKTQQHPAMKAI